MNDNIINTLDHWENQLKESLSFVKKKKAAVKRAEAAFNKAENEAENIRYRRDMALIDSWRGNIDWRVILHADAPGRDPKYSYTMYKYSLEIIEGLGFSSNGTNTETIQKYISIHFESRDLSELNYINNSVLFLSNHLKPIKGFCHFGVSQPNSENYHICLMVNKKNHSAYVKKQRWGREDKDWRKTFSSTHEALRFIQLEISGHDYLDEDMLMIENQA